MSASQDSSGAAHLARILAADAQHNTASLSGPYQQDPSSSYMTPPANVSIQPAHRQRQQEASSDFGAQQAWEDDVAYLAPALAFNLELQHELWPLMPQIPTASDADRQSLTGAVQGTANQHHDGQSHSQLHSTSIQLLIRPLRQSALKKVVEVPQSGMFCGLPQL